jgi:hypothetical protein
MRRPSMGTPDRLSWQHSLRQHRFVLLDADAIANHSADNG